MASLVASLRVREPESTSWTVAEHSHAEDIEPLPAGILRPHVHLAGQPEQRAGGCGGHAVLARAGLGNDSLLAHAFGQQGLPDGVVDFVGTGVGEVFSLQEDGGPTDDAGQLGARRQWRGPTHIVLQKSIQFRAELLICQRFFESCVEFLKGWDQRLGNVASTKLTKSSGGIRLGWVELRIG